MKTRRTIVVIAVALGLVLLLAVGLFAGGLLWSRTPYSLGRGMPWSPLLHHGLMPGLGGYRFPFGMHMFGGGWIMFLLWLVVLAALGLGASALIRHNRPPAAPNDSAIEILKRRYARGEIDREEFERMRETLLGHEEREV